MQNYINVLRGHMNKKFLIKYEIIDKVLGSRRKLRALALALCFKNMFVSSAVNKFSINRIAKLMHISWPLANKCVETCIKMGWATMSDNGKQVVFTKLHNEEKSFAVTSRIILEPTDSVRDVEIKIYAIVLERRNSLREKLATDRIKANRKRLSKTSTSFRKAKSSINTKCGQEHTRNESGLSYKTISLLLWCTPKTAFNKVEKMVELELIKKHRNFNVLYSGPFAQQWYNNNVDEYGNYVPLDVNKHNPDITSVAFANPKKVFVNSRKDAVIESSSNTHSFNLSKMFSSPYNNTYGEKLNTIGNEQVNIKLTVGGVEFKANSVKGCLNGHIVWTKTYKNTKPTLVDICGQMVDITATPMLASLAKDKTPSSAALLKLYKRAKGR